MGKPNLYKSFALVYDEAIDPSIRFLSFVKKFARKKNARVLDIGCGTGKYTIPLAWHGFQIKGVDSSKEMLAIAKKKATKAGLKVKFECSKIECFKEKEKFDVVVSGDCLNHLLKEKNLLQAFSSVHHLLGKKGKFIFQIYTKKYMQHISLEEPYAGRVGKNFFVWENFFRKGMLEIKMSVFTALGRERFKRTEETVAQRPYTRAIVTKNLSKAGFVNVRVFDAVFGEPSRSSEELYFVAETP